MLFSSSFKRSMQSRGGRSQFKAIGAPKLTKLKYRLYADGSIYDNELNRVVGYIVDDLDNVYKMRARSLQKYIKDFLKE